MCLNSIRTNEKDVKMGDEHFRILFQGDSITDCGRSREVKVPNSQLGQGYVQFIAGRILCDNPDRKVEIYNRGISGNRVVDLYARWKIDALNLKPDVISILIGVNDTWHEFGSQNGVEVPRYEQIYRMLLEWTVKELPNVKLILCEPFVLQCGAVGENWVPEMNRRRKVVASLSKEFNTVFVPFQSAIDRAAKLAPPEYWLTDGVHPSCAGHTLLSDVWLESTSEVIR